MKQIIHQLRISYLPINPSIAKTLRDQCVLFKNYESTVLCIFALLYSYHASLLCPRRKRIKVCWVPRVWQATVPCFLHTLSHWVSLYNKLYQFAGINPISLTRNLKIIRVEKVTWGHTAIYWVFWSQPMLHFCIIR